MYNAFASASLEPFNIDADAEQSDRGTIVMTNATTQYFSMMKLIDSKYNNMIFCSCFARNKLMEIASDGIALYFVNYNCSIIISVR